MANSFNFEDLGKEPINLALTRMHNIRIVLGLTKANVQLFSVGFLKPECDDFSGNCRLREAQV